MPKKLLHLLTALLIFVTIAESKADELTDINAAISASGANWTAGRTPLTDLTREQRKGLLATVVHSGSPASAAVYASPDAVLPAALDWRNYDGHSYVTSIKDQKTCGACWAFSAVASLESKVLIDLQEPDVDLDLSEQFMISCSGYGCSTGTTIEGAAIFVRDTGVPPEACDPFISADGSCSSACSDWGNRAYKITGYSRINNTVDDLKNGVAAFGVVAAAMLVYDDFFSYKSGIYSHVSGNLVGWHGINIVGYDDSGGYFIGKNSWGTAWGECGFFRIAYSEVSVNSDFGTSAIAYVKSVIPPVTDPSPPLQLSCSSSSSPAPAGTASATVNTGSQDTKSACFIAAAAYGDHTSPDVQVLEHFRDECLMRSRLGRRFVVFYYRVSPSIATYIGPRPYLRSLTRYLIKPLVYSIKYPLAPVSLLLFCLAALIVRRRRRSRSFSRSY